ncbi:MAG: hypothetical protein GXY08_05110 [Ruminococcus sp.]|nr:hypothetical protein [Ruminococcus sp.]
MKKITAVLASVLISAASLSAMSASAYEDDGYSPTLYFKAQESEDFIILNSGKAYYNKSAAKNDESTLNVNTYVRDDKKLIGGLIARWQTDPAIKLTNLKQPETLPYHTSEAYYKISLTGNKDKNFLNVYYPQITMTESNVKDPNYHFYFDVTGKNTDDYPLATYDAVVTKDTPNGEYSVDFIYDNLGGTQMLYKPTANDSKLFYPDEYNAPGLKIGVTDRLLGDIDNSGNVDGSDATLCLRAFGNLLNGKPSGLTQEQEVCADVDGNGSIDGSDATLILKYFSYQLSFGDTDFNELIKSNLNK